MSVTDRAKRILLISHAALEATQVIGAAVSGLLSRRDSVRLDEVLAILGGIDAVTTSIEKGLNEEATADQIAADVRELKDGIAAVNAQIDQQIDQKFPK